MPDQTCYACNKPIYESPVLSCRECGLPFHRGCLDDEEICQADRERIAKELREYSDER